MLMITYICAVSLQLSIGILMEVGLTCATLRSTMYTLYPHAGACQ